MTLLQFSNSERNRVNVKQGCFNCISLQGELWNTVRFLITPVPFLLVCQVSSLPLHFPNLFSGFFHWEILLSMPTLLRCIEIHCIFLPRADFLLRLHPACRNATAPVSAPPGAVHGHHAMTPAPSHGRSCQENKMEEITSCRNITCLGLEWCPDKVPAAILFPQEAHSVCPSLWVLCGLGAMGAPWGAGQGLAARSYRTAPARSGAAGGTGNKTRRLPGDRLGWGQAGI